MQSELIEVRRKLEEYSAGCVNIWVSVVKCKSLSNKPHRSSDQCVTVCYCQNIIKWKQLTSGCSQQHVEFGDRPSTSCEHKPRCRQTSFNTTVNLYRPCGGSLVSDPALRPCCEKRISLQGSIKCHISTIMHSGEVKQEQNYLCKSLRHINHAFDASTPNWQLHPTFPLSGKMSRMNTADCHSEAAAWICTADGLNDWLLTSEI